MTYQPQNQNLTTGVVSGCVVSINVDPTRFNISSGTVCIEDWSNPLEMRLKHLSYVGVIGQLPPNPTTSVYTGLFLISSATEGIAELQMVEQSVFNTQTRRERVSLSAPIHSSGDGVISNLSEDVQVAYGWAQSNVDMNHCRGACNSGNIISANGTNLNIDKGVGETGMEFINAANEPWINPAIRPNPLVLVQGIVYQAQAPAGPFLGGLTTLVDPNNYDNNGVITVVPNNRWTVQPVYFFGQSGTMTLGYGQIVYNTQVGAEAGIKDSIVRPANTFDGVLVAHLIVKQGTTDLSDISDNTIINV